MGRVKDIKNEKKIEISTLIKLKEYSFREIARKTGVSCQTVARIAKKLDEGVSPRANKRRNCRSARMTSAREDRKIISTALRNRKAPLQVLNNMLKAEAVNISSRTLRRRLYEENLKCHRPTKRPFLNAAMKKKRSMWARLMQDKGQEYWQKVIFKYR